MSGREIDAWASGAGRQSGNGRLWRARLACALFGVMSVTGCASYHPLPLAQQPELASSPAGLDTELPAATAGGTAQNIDTTQPLGISDIGLLAILNDPDLKSEWGDAGLAEAGLLQASLLPNPSATLGFAALLGGPGSTPSYSASLSQDIASLITYHARVSAARAHVGEVNASLLWQEWQVAQKAQFLALDIYYGTQSLALTQRQERLVSREVQQAQAAATADNLAFGALAPLLAAQAAAQQSLMTLNLAQTKQWQALDALLGLAPEARFAIAAPDVPPPPASLGPLIAQLPQQRPDLIALQLGYRASDADLRAAILGQFPAFLLGGSWGSDTTGVRSAGPTITFDLSVFDRNQGKIAQATATRQALHAQYLARLDSAAGSARGIAAQESQLTAALPPARAAAQEAGNLAQAARNAYAQDNLDQLALTDYETTALQRSLEVVDLERSIAEDRLALNVELGLGLPRARIVPDHETEKK